MLFIKQFRPQGDHPVGGASARRSGRRGRGFKSHHSDHKYLCSYFARRGIFLSCKVEVDYGIILLIN